jgi:hypothetical protein
MLAKIIALCRPSIAAFVITGLLTASGCHKDNNNTSSPMITGSISLDSTASLGGVTIQAYPLATMDADVQTIRQSFSTVGTLLSQATEFDHRLSTPVASTTTSANGSFSLAVNPGTYNIVAVQAGYGYSYKLNISASSGTVSTGTIALLKEQELTTISTGASTPVVFDAGRHYIIRNTVYINCPNADVLVKAGAILKFDDGASLNILSAKSFQVTGQDGTPVVFTALNQTGVSAKWNSVLIAAQVPVTIQYAVISNALNGISSNALSFVSNDVVLTKNSPFGMVFSHQGGTDSMQVTLSRLVARDGGGVSISYAKASSVSRSIFARCGNQGINASNAATITIQDNYFLKSGNNSSNIQVNSDSTAIYTTSFNGNIQNNTFESCGIAIGTAYGSMSFITSNEFENNIADVLISAAGGSATGRSSQPTLAQNNFIASKESAVINLNFLDITAKNNFWDTTDSAKIATVKIVDYLDSGNPNIIWGKVTFTPFLTTKNTAAGIQP